jgi:hypothetical protein
MPLALPAHDAFQRIEVTPGLLGAILLQLDPEDFARAGATCPRWRVVVVASNESAVWAAACAPFPLIGLIRAQRIAATQAAKPASGPQVADSWRDLYIQRVLANKRIETAAAESLPPTSDYLIGVELHHHPPDAELPGCFFSSAPNTQNPPAAPTEPLSGDLKQLWEDAYQDWRNENWRQQAAIAGGYRGAIAGGYAISGGASDWRSPESANTPAAIDVYTTAGRRALTRWRDRHRQPVYAHIGELQANCPYENQDLNISLCWVDLNAEKLTHVDQHQLYLSAFLIRKRDGKCATLFTSETYVHGCHYAASGGELEGIYGAHCETEFCTQLDHETASLASHVYSRQCNCPNRNRRDAQPPSPELKDINLFPCTCGAGNDWKHCGLSICMREDDNDSWDEGYEGEEDARPAVDTVQKLLHRLEERKCTKRWA